mgnify:CR=1 FL=1
MRGKLGIYLLLRLLPLLRTRDCPSEERGEETVVRGGGVDTLVVLVLHLNIVRLIRSGAAEQLRRGRAAAAAGRRAGPRSNDCKCTCSASLLSPNSAKPPRANTPEVMLSAAPTMLAS